jgi:uncharacterized LabA/DUF88 family protein
MTNTALVSVTQQRKARKPRILIAVDVQNMQNGTARLDYAGLVRGYQECGELVTAMAFVTDAPTQVNLQLMLVQNGYEVVRVRPTANGSGELKGDADIQLAFRLGREVERRRLGKGDIVVLCTGDGDFAPIVEWLRLRDIRVEVVAFKGSTSPHLQIAASKFRPIDETPTLQYKPVSAA